MPTILLKVSTRAIPTKTASNVPAIDILNRFIATFALDYKYYEIEVNHISIIGIVQERLSAAMKVD